MQNVPLIDTERLRGMAQKRLDQVAAGTGSSLKTLSVKARLVKDYLKEADIGSHQVLCDERPDLGGGNAAPTPLEYFLAGFAFCELTILTQYAATMRLDLEAVEFEVTGLIDFRGKYGVGNAPVGFQKIKYQVRIRSREPEERVLRLARLTRERCPAYNTLKGGGVALEGDLVVNGKMIGGIE